MPVRVIFADASRAAAHNLDDLYERWQLRREKEEKLRKAKLPDFQFTDYTNPLDLEEAARMRDELIKRMQALQLLLGNKSAVTESGCSIKAREYYARRHTLNGELNYILANLRMVNKIIKDWNKQGKVKKMISGGNKYMPWKAETSH